MNKPYYQVPTTLGTYAAVNAYGQVYDMATRYASRYGRGTRGNRRTATSAARPYSGSRTITVTKRKKKTPSGKRRLDNSSGYSKKKAEPLYIKVGRQLAGTKTGLCEITERVEATQGKQAYTSFDWNHGTKDPIYATGRSIPEQFENVYAVGSSWVHSDRFYLDYTKMTLEMANSTAVQIKIRIMDCIRKKNSCTTNTCAADWEHGMYEEMAAGSYNRAYDHPGLQPLKNSQFHSDWKILKSVHRTLQPGEIHTHNTFVSMKRAIRGKDCFDGTTGHGQIRGLTRATLVIVYGTPMNSLAANTDIGWSKAKVNVISRFETKGFHLNLSKDDRITIPQQITKVKEPKHSLVDLQTFDVTGEFQNPNVN